MRITILLLFVLTFQLQAEQIYSQDTKISLDMRNSTIEKVLQTIEEKSDYYFLYNNKLIDVDRKVSVKVKNAAISAVLEKLFKSEDVDYEVKGAQIILSPKEMHSLAATAEALQQQKKQITGTIVDATGVPIIGANIIEAGTTNGTVTDADGKFSLSVNNNATIHITYIGYLEQSIATAGQSAFNVTLLEDTRALEEVVVVGYGVQKKANLTGAVAQVKGEDLVKRQVVNPVASLQGLVSGLRITQNSGQPGAENLSIEVRGMGTFSSAGSAPLVLIDGVPGSLSDLNPNSISNISVLKDAASSAIYGARAANGVILVTTKDGSNSDGKFTVEYMMNAGFSTATRLPELVTNSVEYMTLSNQAKTNSGITSASQLYPQSIIDLYKNPSDPVKYPNANWADLMFSTAPTYMHTISVSGGTKTTYNVLLGYVDQKGIMKAFNYNKYTAKVNLNSTINSKWKIGINFGLKQGDRAQPKNGADDSFYQTLAHAPTALPYLPDGSGRYTYRAYNWESVRPNQFAAMEQLTKTTDYAVTSQIWSDYQITKELNWYVKGAANGYFTRNKTFSTAIPLYDYFADENTVATSNIPGTGLNTYMEQTLYRNVFTYLNFDKAINQHSLGLQAGYSEEVQNYYYLQGSRTNFSTDKLSELNAGDATPQYNSGTSNTWALRSLFGRLKYNYLGKYLFESNLRYDGSSRFSEKSRWGLFPSFSAAWRVSEENFLKGLNNNGVLNDLKVRASWGQLGNQNIGLYPYQSLINIGNNYPFGQNLTTGAYQSSLNNENISWETTTMADVGLDIIMFRHLNITIDAYKKETTDILRQAQVAGVVGLSAPMVNSGAMTNTGLELSINYENKVRNGFFNGLSYSSGFNISGFRNKTTKFGKMQDNGATVIEEGLPWNTFYLLQWDGIFQSPEEIATSPKQFGEVTVPGDLKFKDVSGPDGKPDGKIDNDDRVKMKDGVFPKFIYSFSFNTQWKGFDFYCFLQGVHGQKGIFGLNRTPGLTPFFSGTAPLKKVADEAWTPENHSNTQPRLYFSDYSGSEKVWNHPSTFLLQDMSYLRIKQIQLGYTLPSALIQEIGLSNLRIYVAGDNLLTFSNFLGTDPEKPAGSYLTYPQNKTISFGLSVKF